jgi:alpha-beta hydrolase superfamily lysophospholipase
VKPFYLTSGRHEVAAIFQASDKAVATSTAVLIVPPFGWDDQTSYRPRRDWSLALAQAGFANLRIDLPGTGDSSGTGADEQLVDAWTAAVTSGFDWLRSTGAARIAVIALGSGGLVTLQAIARGAIVEDLILWGMPITGRALIREIKAFGRLEQFQTGEPAEDLPSDQLCAGGHMLAHQTLSDLSSLDSKALIGLAAPERALVLGRDGMGPDGALLEALRSAGADVSVDPGYGWGEALARPQSTSPTALFEVVNLWLAARAPARPRLRSRRSKGFLDLGSSGARLRETPIVFERAGQQLYAILSKPLDVPVADGTVIMFNAGAIRRIGPSRIWTEAARRWAAAGIPVIRIDIEGIGDAGGEGGKYADGDEAFYTPNLVEQAKGALELAKEMGLPDRFVLGGLCSGAYWSFEIAVSDPRVSGVMMLNPRLLVFDEGAEGNRELRKLGRVLTRSGFRNMLLEKQKLRRAGRFASYLLNTPQRMMSRPAQTARGKLSEALATLHRRGQRIDIAFSSDEPLHQELSDQSSLVELSAMGVEVQDLPYKSHTLKPLKAQKAANAWLDQIVQRNFPRLRLTPDSSPGARASARDRPAA